MLINARGGAVEEVDRASVENRARVVGRIVNYDVAIREHSDVPSEFAVGLVSGWVKQIDLGDGLRRRFPRNEADHCCARQQ